METTKEKQAVNAEEKAQKLMERRYNTYKNACEKVGQDVISFQEFSSKTAEADAKQEAENAIELDSEKVAVLGAMGWEVQKHTRKTGGNLQGKSYEYLVNKEAAANGTGFLKLSKSKLENTKVRLQSNIDAIDLVLEGLKA